MTFSPVVQESAYKRAEYIARKQDRKKKTDAAQPAAGLVSQSRQGGSNSSCVESHGYKRGVVNQGFL